MSNAKLEWLASVHKAEVSIQKLIQSLDRVGNNTPENFKAAVQSDPEVILRMLREVSSALMAIQTTHLKTVELHLDLLDQIENT